MLCVIALICVIAPSLSSAAPLTRPLAVGSRGEDVTTLQKVLATLGFFKEEATGYFGKITRAAVIAFQTGNGLEPVGSVGPKTRALVNAFMLVPEKPAPVSVPETTSTTPPMMTAPVLPATFPTTTPATASSTQATLTITVITPASVLPKDTSYATLLVTTNKTAYCRWGTNQNMEFSRKTAFKYTGGQSHSHEFSNLGSSNLYVYYVQCEDAVTLQQSADTTVSFSVSATSATAPTLSAQLAAVATFIGSSELWPAFDPVATILRGFGFR